MLTCLMRRINPLLLLMCVSLTLLPSAAATAAPRDVVEQVATLIENNYFDPTRAAEVARDLRTRAQSGEFDSLQDPRDLATAVTARLQPRDHHFRLTWSPAGRPTSDRPDSADPGPAQSLETLERRNAYGFRRVEMLPGALGYIDLRTFADFSFAKPDEPARLAADAALALVSSADAVIIDLRNNAGGSPNMVGYLVSAFTPSDANIYNTIQNRDSTESERPKQSYSKPRLDVPLYILISGRTASAAESTAYTLQAAKRAVIVGEISAGAANPGGELPVGNGFNGYRNQLGRRGCQAGCVGESRESTGTRRDPGPGGSARPESEQCRDTLDTGGVASRSRAVARCTAVGLRGHLHRRGFYRRR